MDKRQLKYDTAKADIEAQEESLLGLKFLPGDRDRHMEIQGQWDARLDKMIEDSGGDYSQIQGQLDRYKRDLNRETNYGELASQSSDYASAFKQKAAIDKRVLAGTASREGAALFNQSVQKHQTTQTDAGFSSFQGYDPSSITNVTKFLQDNVDEINAKWDDEGMKNISRENITSNMMNVISTNSDLRTALKESFAGSARKDETFAKYQTRILEGVISDKRYQERMEESASAASGRLGARELQNVGMPARLAGQSDYRGGSFGYGKAILDSVGIGDSTKVHKDFVNSEEGQREIDYIKWKTGKEFPESYLDQRNWFMENGQDRKTAKVFLDPATGSDKSVINNAGFLNTPDVAVRDKAGNVLSSDEIDNIEGASDEGNIFRVVNRVRAAGGAYPLGTVLAIGNDGEEYFIENHDPELMRSEAYSIDAIKAVENSNTGKTQIKLHAPLGEIPAGTFKVIHRPRTKENPKNEIYLYKGKDRYLFSNGITRKL